MVQAVKLIDLELSSPLAPVTGLRRYGALQGLVRLHGTPLGWVRVPVERDLVTADEIALAIAAEYFAPLIQHLLADWLTLPPPSREWSAADLLGAPHPSTHRAWPSVTVAICTRDRTAELAHCLDAICQLDYPSLDLLVVDNSPRDNSSERLVQDRYPSVRYVRELRPGLDWARNRAIAEARGEILAFTDDDARVDPGWVRALVEAFDGQPDAMAVTGLVVPAELETEAQAMFERYGGFGRGFERRRWHVVSGDPKRWSVWGTGHLGTGANMAYRRALFDQVGLFDPALDVGTPTNGGGDLEMFFRVLKEGYSLVYEPAAVVRHRHRRDYGELRTQLANNGVGFFSYLQRSARAYPDERWALLRLAVWWSHHWGLNRLLKSFVKPTGYPRELIVAELRGALVGLRRYDVARAAAARLAGERGLPLLSPLIRRGRSRRPAFAVRSIDLGQPLEPLVDVEDFAGVRVFVTHFSRPIGSVDIANGYRQVGSTWLRDELVSQLGLKLLSGISQLSEVDLWAQTRVALVERLRVGEAPRPATIPIALSAGVSVSVVVATRDRPTELRSCLARLVAQQSTRRVEIVVSDNNPTSGLTAPVVAAFPGVMLVEEPRRGLPYARNAGIVASTGDVIVMTDDDVEMPPTWLETLIAPLARADVSAVTGNVLPLKLETEAQRLFELYGGLGRGFRRREADGTWFAAFGRDAVPTWELGATANAAFRASIFADSRIGLLDEALGPGTPTGCGEDIYLFYRILRAGHTLVYEPSAYVWHTHRSDLAALRRQLYDYSKGHVAYHLTTLLRHGDLRALPHLAIRLPRGHLWRIRRRLSGRDSYPLRLTLVEICGHLAGPWALWRSYCRVRRDGRSGPYVPPIRRLSRGCGEHV